jgi:hypothetical protein
MKDEIRVLGIDDGYFLKHGGKNVLVVGAILRGNKDLEGVISCHITKDGNDSTKRLIGLVNGSRHKNQLRYMITNGTTLGGFNLLDINELYRKTRVPVLAVLRKKPDQQKVERALDHFPDKRKRLERMRKAGQIYSYRRLYFQMAGLTEGQARELIDKTVKIGNLPEPVRIAHLIASGVTYGESTKRA